MDLSSVDKSKHKFMVQSMFAPPDFVSDNLDQLWRTVPKTELMDSKLKCSFVEDQSSQPAGENSESEPLPPYSSEGPGVEELASPPEAGKEEMFTSVTGEAILHVPSPQQPTKPEEEEEPAVKPTPKPAVVHSTAGSTPAHVAKSEREHAELESKLRAMQSTIDQLSAENTQLKGETNKLRQRFKPTPGAAATTAKFPPSPSPAPSSPLNIVAILHRCRPTTVAG
jgi:hypothetical protein